jgi:hypothetical protein
MYVCRDMFIPCTFNPEGVHADKLAVLADELAFRTSVREDYQKGYYINFGRDDWKRISSKTYGAIADAAVEQGLIERNHSYSSNANKNSRGKKFPKSLRLAEPHRTAELKQYLLKKPIKRAARLTNKIAPDDVVRQWLASKLMGFTEPPEATVEAAIASAATKHARSCIRASARRARAKNYFVSCCDYGRLHSNFTNMKKELRKGFTFNGKPLIGVDIANSQPAVLVHVLSQHVGADLSDEEKYLFKLGTGVHAGKFYEKLLVSPELFGLTRKQIKIQFFESLYGSIRQTKGSRIFKLIQQHFPVFADAILDIKKDDHAHLSHRLQRTESKIVIDRCCGWLMEHYPNMPIITVHDEIMTTREYVSLVQLELRAAFLQETGFLCSITTKPKYQLTYQARMKDLLSAV